MDRRSSRKPNVHQFIDRISKNRQENINSFCRKSEKLKPSGIIGIDRGLTDWTFTRGTLLKQKGKRCRTVSISFRFPVKLGNAPLPDVWKAVAQALFVVRYHRCNQAAANHRTFLKAIGYVVHEAVQLNIPLEFLTREVLDNACHTISDKEGTGTSYNLHKAVNEFAGHCDANKLCRIALDYKYHGMKRPENTGGVGIVRLDDPKATVTESERIVSPQTYRVLSELFSNVPKNHKYRIYILILVLNSCLGRRLSEILTLPKQDIKSEPGGQKYINYFPRKTSIGNVVTPLRPLYLPTETVEIVEKVIEEAQEVTDDARITARAMRANRGADISFLDDYPDELKLYICDLPDLGISKGLLSPTRWFNKNGYRDEEYCSGIGLIRPYVIKSSVIEYCNSMYYRDMVKPIEQDQSGEEYYLDDMMFIRPLGLSSGAYAHWISTTITHSMLSTFMKYLPALAEEYANSALIDTFTSHDFRHTINTLLDEGGLSDLLQTEWFMRSNPRDTKAYQNTSRQKRALMVREDLKSGKANGRLADQVRNKPVGVQDAILQARVRAVHDVGPGMCVHDFAQTSCERHLQCSADCKDYVWVDDDEGRVNDVKRQYAITTINKEKAVAQSEGLRKKKSKDWILHSDKKLKTYTKQLKSMNVTEFDPHVYLEELENEKK